MIITLKPVVISLYKPLFFNLARDLVVGYSETNMPLNPLKSMGCVLTRYEGGPHV